MRSAKIVPVPPRLDAGLRVLARYGVSDYATGALGVVGPMRMPYGRTVGTVRYVADLMTNLVSDMYSGSEESTDRD